MYTEYMNLFVGTALKFKFFVLFCFLVNSKLIFRSRCVLVVVEQLLCYKADIYISPDWCLFGLCPFG